jgi:hypothetical protein
VNRTELFDAICELSETEARLLMNNVNLHYGWSSMVLERTDAQNVAGRSFTDEEWDSLRTTSAWNWFVQDCVSNRWVERLHNLMGDLGLLGGADG